MGKVWENVLLPEGSEAPPQQVDFVLLEEEGEAILIFLFDFLLGGKIFGRIPAKCSKVSRTFLEEGYYCLSQGN